MTGTNWTGNNVPTATQTAQFGTNPTSGVTGVGINMNTAGFVHQVGAIEITTARSAALLIGNSSTTAAATGTLQLNGVTVNGTDNVVLRNNSAQLLTLQNTQGSGNRTMDVSLGNATNNVVNIDGAGGITISSIIKGAGSKLTLDGTGNGNLTFSGTSANTYSGLTSINAGRLELNKTGVNAIAGNVAVGDGVGAAGTAVLRLRASNQIADGSSISIASDGTFNIETFDDSVGAVTLNGGSIIGTTGVLSSSGYSFNSGTVSAKLAGAGALTKATAGTVTLSGTNTYGGGTNINGGILALESAGALGSTGAISFGGGTLQHGGSNTTDYSGRFATGAGQQYRVDTNGVDVAWAGGLTSSGGMLTKLGNGTLTLGSNDANANTFSGLTTVSGGTLLLNKANGTNAIAGDVIIGNGGTLSWNRSNQIADASLITMNGGAMNLNGFTERIGSFTNDGGVFATGQNGHLLGTGATVSWASGTSNTINDGGSVEDSHFAISGGLNVVEGGANGGILRVAGGGGGLELSGFGALLRLNSDNAVAGKLLLEGDVAVHGNSPKSIISAGSSANAGTVELVGNRTFTVDSGSSLSISAMITNGALTKTGDGALSLSRSNTYAGGTTLSAGVLQLTGSGTLGSTSATLAVNGGTLDLGGTNQAVGALNGSGGTIHSSTATSMLTVGGNDGSGSYGGTIANGSGTVGLTKTGAGTQTLAGTNTYTGNTQIDGGILRVNGSLASSATVAFGGRLDGIGSIGGDVTNNGAVAPGNSPGTLTIGSTYTQNSMAELIIAIIGTDMGQFSILNVGGSVALAGTLTPLLSGSFMPMVGDSFQFMNWVGATTGSFTSVAQNLGTGMRWAMTYNSDGQPDGNRWATLNVVADTPAAVPESGSTLLLLSTVLIGFWLCRGVYLSASARTARSAQDIGQR